MQLSLNHYLSEQWLLRQPGPPLSSCRNLSPTNQILIESETTHNIIFQKDVHSSIRAYYYSLLCVIFEAGTEESTRVERHFRNVLLNQRVRLDQFDIPVLRQKHKEFYNNVSLKKLIVEMLTKMSQRQKDSIQHHGLVKSVINQYPIMDLVMTLLIRSIINYHRYTSILVSSKISTRVIAECFWELFGFGSYEIGPNIWAFQILEITYNSNGVYDEIGRLDQFLGKSSTLRTVVSIEKPTFEIIQQASKEQSLSDLNLSLDEVLCIPNKEQKYSVTSSLQSIHLKLKCFEFEESVSEISRRQSMEDDSFVDKENLFAVEMEEKEGKEEREQNGLWRKRPTSPMRVNMNKHNV